MAGDEPQERKHEGSVREFCSNHMKTLVTLVMIFGTIICIVLIVMVHKWRFEGEKLEEIAACIDVAIIGAGISGSYAGWRMRHDTRSHIHIFEMSDHAGGRFHTERFPEYEDHLRAELGAVYYFPQLHQLLNRSIHALKLTPEGYYPPNHVPPTYYFRGTHLTRKDFRPHSRYFMDHSESGQTPPELKRYFTDEYLKNVNKNPLSQRYKNVNLYDMGYWNFLRDVASQEAFNFIKDGAQWKSHVTNGNAALLASTDLNTWEQHYTLAEGMDALPEAMAKEFNDSSDKHVVHYNKRLVCIEREQWGESRYYRLMYQHTETVAGVTVNITKSSRFRANKIILAISPAAMKNIKFLGFDEETPALAELVDEVLDPVPVMTAYFMFNQTWWDGSTPEFQDVVTDLPIRHLRYLGKSRLKQSRTARSPRTAEYGYLFLVANPDLDDVAFFDPLLTNGPMWLMNSGCNLTVNAIKNLKKQIAQAQRLSDHNAIPDPVRTFIKDWRSTPSYAGWHMWRVGVNWEEAAARLRKPFPEDEIYLIGGDLCPGNCQFWAEGALQTVESLLEEYFTQSFNAPIEAKDFHHGPMDIDITSKLDSSIYD